MPRFIRVVGASVLIASPLGAQQSDSTLRDSVRVFDPVVVTAARRDERRSNAVVATKVVTRDDIRAAAATNIATVLTQQLGLQTASGSPAGTQVLIQGLGDQRVLVLLDGQPVAGRVGGVLDLSRLPASIVERIEVIKGPQSVLYGTDAMGGVINVITRRPSRSAEASVIAGSHNRLDVSTRIGGSIDPSTSVGVDVGRNHVDLAPGITGDVGTVAEQWSVTPRVTWKRSSSLTVDAGGLGIIERQRYRSGQLFNFSDNTQIGTRVGATWTHGMARVTPTLSYSGFEHLSRAARTTKPASDSGARDVQRLLTGTLNYSNLIGGMLVDAGTELRRESIQADRVPGDRSTNAAAVFAQTTWMNSAISIAPGARASWSEQWGTSVTPRVALMAKPLGVDNDARLRLSVARGFRVPDFKELYLRFVNAAAGYAVAGNVDLRPEHSTNFTADLEWRGLRASAFQNRIRDLIETVGPDAGGTYTYDNVGRATTAGFELEADQRWERVEMNAGYAYLHARDVESATPILGRAAHTARGSVRLRAPRDVRLSLTTLYTGNAPASRDAQGNISATRAAFTQVNARVARPFGVGGSRVEVSAGADNVFDVQRAGDWPGFTGRQFSVGLAWPAR